MSNYSSRIMIVEARFYDDLADEMVTSAEAVLAEANAEVRRVQVPGAFEIPAAIAMAETICSVHYDGYVALGCVIRGETTHYDYVCGESARALQDMAVRDKLAIGYGILTVENFDQAWARADRSRGNKGADAAKACLTMIDLARDFGRS